MSEVVLLERPDVQVTNARFIVRGQTYAMSNITSVRGVELKPSRKGAIVCILIGALTMWPAISEGRPEFLLGSLFWIGIGVLWWRLKKAKYRIMLVTAGGEAEAHTTTNKLAAGELLDELNRAIVARG